MEKLLFIGTEKGTSQKGNDYFLVHYGREIKETKGVGYKPVTSKIDADEFVDFSKLDMGCEFTGTVESTKNSYGGYTYTLRRYEF